MADEAYWADLRPILQDMADRIARIEQFLVSSGASGAAGFQAPGAGPYSASSGAGAVGPGEVFDAVPASFGTAPFGGPRPGVVPDDILFLARSGKKIQAINEYRKRTGIGLKEAKDIIDQAARGY